MGYQERPPANFVKVEHVDAFDMQGVRKGVDRRLDHFFSAEAVDQVLVINPRGRAILAYSPANFAQAFKHDRQQLRNT